MRRCRCPRAKCASQCCDERECFWGCFVVAKLLGKLNVSQSQRSPRIELRTARKCTLNPNGIAAPSPGLPRSGYPGTSNAPNHPNPERVASVPNVSLIEIDVVFRQQQAKLI